MTTIITKEMIDNYGYPDKYIGYNVAISPAGVDTPFTFLEICKMAWPSLKYGNISSEENILIVNTQIEQDINRNTMLINGIRLDNIQYIDTQLNIANVTPDNAVLIKSLMNQFPVTYAWWIELRIIKFI